MRPFWTESGTSMKISSLCSDLASSSIVMTKVICYRYFLNRWKTDRHCFSKSFNARARKVSAKVILRLYLKRWNANRTHGAIYKNVSAFSLRMFLQALLGRAKGKHEAFIST